MQTQNYVGGMFVNKNAGIQNVWTYDPDLNNPAFLNATQRSVNLRLTWQASATNKLSFFADDQGRCQCPNVTATMAPEAAIEIEYPIQRMMTAAWTSHGRRAGCCSKCAAGFARRTTSTARRRPAIRT